MSVAQAKTKPIGRPEGWGSLNPRTPFWESPTAQRVPSKTHGDPWVHVEAHELPSATWHHPSRYACLRTYWRPSTLLRSPGPSPARKQSRWPVRNSSKRAQLTPWRRDSPPLRPVWLPWKASEEPHSGWSGRPAVVAVGAGFWLNRMTWRHRRLVLQLQAAVVAGFVAGRLTAGKGSEKP